MNKLCVTFKKQPRSTGLAAIGESTVIDMKIKKRKFGYITSPSWIDSFFGWRVVFAVKVKKELGIFSWKRLSKHFQTPEEAKKYAKEFFSKEENNNNLYFFED